MAELHAHNVYCCITYDLRDGLTFVAHGVSDADGDDPDLAVDDRDVDAALHVVKAGVQTRRLRTRPAPHSASHIHRARQHERGAVARAGRRVTA